MVKIKLRALLVAISICAFSWNAPVQAEGWSWNPFSTKSESKSSSPLYKSPVSKTSSNSSSNSWWPEWKTPQMPWTSSKANQPSSYSKNKATTWQKMTSTSKRWWDKTADVLDPYPDPKPKPVSTSSTAKKKSWYEGWFQKEETRKIENVNDFLKQERIE